jgi:hypothetical protein
MVEPYENSWIWKELKKIFAQINHSLYESFMTTTTLPRTGHAGPNPGIVAIIYALLFNAGLYFVVSFRPPEHLAPSATAVRPFFPDPWESAETITAYFQTHLMRS